MRTLVLALVFLNLVFFGYVRLVGVPAREAGASAAPGDAPRLLLASEAGGPGRRCTTVGPFAEQALAERAAEWLRGDGRTPRLRSAAAEGVTGWWVALPTTTLQQATRVSMRLRAAGVTDVEVLPPATGATEATVSLGLYGDRSRAEQRVQELQRYAVTPRITEQPQPAPTWWLDVARVPGDSPIDVTALQGAVPGAAGLVSDFCPEPPAPAPRTPRSERLEPPDGRPAPRAFG